MTIGEKIKNLRLAGNLTQEELASRCELSKGFISQLERDMTSPSIATLTTILSCLGTDLPEFFRTDEQKQVVFSSEDYAVKNDTETRSKTCWLIPNAQKNQMEPILFTLKPGGESLNDNPHEGEEFGYLLTGQIIIRLGSRIIPVKKGESFYYQADQPHQLVNPGKTAASLVWVSTPPSF